MRGLESVARVARDAAMFGVGRAVGRPGLELPWRLRRLNGWLKRAEAALLYRSVAGAGTEGDLLEIGSWEGRSTVVIGRALEDHGLPGVLHAIDPHDDVMRYEEITDKRPSGPTLDVLRRNLDRERVAGRVRILQAYSDDGLAALAEEGVRVRFAFVDGGHEYDQVARDLEGVLGLLLPGATVAIHDCVEDGPFPGVWRAYRAVLGDRFEEVARKASLVVARPSPGA